MTQEQLHHLQILGFDAVVDTTTKVLQFDPIFRTYCKANTCGSYCRNYACPPLCGTPAEMQRKALSYPRMLVLQKRCSGANLEEAVQHERSVRQSMDLAVAYLQGEGYTEPLVSAPGPCRRCETCGASRASPCPHPQQIYSCISAYCIRADALASAVGLPYDEGEDTICFFCLYLYR